MKEETNFRFSSINLKYLLFIYLYKGIYFLVVHEST